MKRVMAVLLVVMLLFILTACSDYKDYSEQLEREVHIEEKLDYEGCGVVVTDVKQDSSEDIILVCLTVKFINATDSKKIFENSELKLTKAIDQYEEAYEYQYAKNENVIVCPANSTVTYDIYFKSSYSVISNDTFFIVKKQEGLFSSTKTGIIRLKYRDSEKQITETDIVIPAKKTYGINDPQQVLEQEITVTVTKVTNVDKFKVGSVTYTTQYNFVFIFFTIKNNGNSDYITADPEDCRLICNGSSYTPSSHTYRFSDGYESYLKIGAKMSADFCIVFDVPYKTTESNCIFKMDTINKLLDANYIEFELY